ncbi:hypothetical protein Tco_0298564 [Tanacetum coccineum]
MLQIDVPQHQGESRSGAWTRFKDLLQKVPHHGIDLWLQVQIFYDHVNPATRRTIDQSAGGKLRDKNAEESWALLEDLAIYDNESWNDPRNFAKLVKAISLPQDVLMNKISSSCEICSGPHDTQYCMGNPEQAFVEYASSCTDEAGDIEGLVSKFMASQNARLSKFEADFKQQQGEMTNKIDTVLKAVIDRITGALPSNTQPNKSYDDKSEEEARKEEGDPENINTTPPSPLDLSISFITKKVYKLNSFLESSDLVPRSSHTEFFCTKDDGDVMFIKIIRKYDDSHEEGPEDEENTTTEGLEVEYFDTFLTRSELAYHKYLMSGPIPSLFLRNPIITKGCPSNLKIPCNIGHRTKLDPRKDPNIGVSNFTGRIKGMYIFVGNFTYFIDFMIIEDISSIVDPRLSQVVLWKLFVEISNMTHDPSLGVVKFTDRIDEIAYKMPHKIKQYDSLSDLEKEHMKLVYLRNEEDKRRGVEYVISKILGFYKECLELRPEYLTRVADEGEVTLYLMRRSLEVPRKFPDDYSWRTI